jgi:hypothetical protein
MSTVKSILIASLNTFLCKRDILVYDVWVKLPSILSFLALVFLPTRVWRWLLFHLIILNDTHTYTHTHTGWDSSGQGIGPSSRTLSDNKQQSQETDIHAPRGIRPGNSIKRTAADPRVRLRGHRNRLLNIVCIKHMLQVLRGFCVFKNT